MYIERLMLKLYNINVKWSIRTVYIVKLIKNLKYGGAYMKVKKIVSVFLIAGALSMNESFVIAQKYLPVRSDSGIITVTVPNPDKKRLIGVIAKKGTDILENDNIFGICETSADSMVFDMPDKREDVDGEYELFVAGKSVGGFFYAKEDSISSVKSALSGMDEEALDATLTSGSEYYVALGAMGFDIEGYAEASDKQKVCSIFKNSYENSMTREETAKCFNTAIGIVNINSGKDVGAELGKLNPVFEGTGYIETDENLKSWINEYIKTQNPYDSIEDFENSYKCANILNLFNNAKFSDMNGLMDKYKLELGIESDSTYIKYLELNKSQQTRVHDEMVELLDSSLCNTPESFKEILSLAVSQATSGGTGSSSGGGGGGSNSGGNAASGTFFPNPDVPQTTISQKSFSDLENVKWAEAAIEALAQKGIVAGDGKGNFNPMNLVTREEFVTMILKATGTQESDETGEFTDVKADAWYAKKVMGAYSAGIVFGVSDKEFGIGKNISREDMSVIAYRALKGRELSKKREFEEFKDFNSVSDYAKDAVKALYEAEIINGKGDGIFDAKGTATRAESAVVIYNLFIK